MVIDMEYPTRGMYQTVGCPIKLSDSQVMVTRAPLLGEHTVELLGELCGVTPEQAWKSLERVNRQTFQPGDQLLFKAGARFRGQLKPQGSGAITNGKPSPIVIGKYGGGSKPRIDGDGQFTETHDFAFKSRPLRVRITLWRPCTTAKWISSC